MVNWQPAIGYVKTWGNGTVIVDKQPTPEQAKFIMEVMIEAYEFYIEHRDDIGSEPSSIDETIVEPDGEVNIQKTDNTWTINCKFLIRTQVYGKGFYDPGVNYGPPEKCYPPDEFYDFTDWVEFNKSKAEEYVKDYFLIAKKIENLIPLEVNLLCGNLEEFTEYRLL